MNLLHQCLLFIVVLVLSPSASIAQCPFTATIDPGSIILCPNEADTLTTQVYDSYQWYQQGVIMQGETLSYLPVDYFNNAGFQYSVEVTLNGCTEMSDTVLVDGWAFLPVTVTSAGSTPWVDGFGVAHHCADDTVYLIINLPYDTNIQWTESGIPIPGATDDTLVVTQTGNYSVSGSPSVCPNYQASLGLSIGLVFSDTTFTPTITGPSNTTLCPGTPDTLTTQVYDWYQWLRNGSWLWGDSNSFYELDPQLNGGASYYQVTVRLNGCQKTTDSVLVSGLDSLELAVDHSGDPGLWQDDVLHLCEGDTHLLILLPPFDQVQQWTQNGQVIPNATDTFLQVTQTGLYNVYAGQTACPFYVDSLDQEINVEVHPLPAAPVITQNGTVLQASGTGSFQWFLNGVAIPGATAANYAPVVSGTYTVSVSDPFQCSSLSEPYVFFMVGIKEATTAEHLHLYPSPAEDILFVQWNGNANANYFIRDITGRTIQTGTLSGDLEELSIGELSKGIYFLEINSSSEKNVVKWIKR